MEAVWKIGYLQGSFRGIEFFISRAQNSSGRRIATHEFPEVDDIQHEDLGRAIRSFNFSAYIIGDNYFEHREDLIKALEAKGPGRLVHPYRGIFRVVCKAFSETESTPEGRMARFDIQFEEQKVIKLTKVKTNTAELAQQSKENLLLQQQNEFSTLYKLNNVAISTVKDATASLENALNVIEKSKQSSSPISDLQKRIANVRGQLIQITLQGGLLSSNLRNLIEFGTNPTDDIFIATPENAADQLLELITIARDNSRPNTDTPNIIYNDSLYPANLIKSLMQQLAIASAVGLVPIIPLGNIQNALELRDQLFNAINEILLLKNTSDIVYEALRDAKKSISEDLDRRILNLSSVVTFHLPESRPTLKVVNEIHGNIENEQKFIDRNKIEHPGFVSGNIDLEVEING